jgi:hypothetical protein
LAGVEQRTRRACRETKFIERNGRRSLLYDRSRDNLPNPVRGEANRHVPSSRPAIGDRRLAIGDWRFGASVQVLMPLGEVQ